MKELLEVLKKYKKRLAKYIIAVFILAFGIGLPIAIWTIKKIGGEETIKKGKQVKQAEKAGKTLQFMSRK